MAKDLYFTGTTGGPRLRIVTVYAHEQIRGAGHDGPRANASAFRKYWRVSGPHPIGALSFVVLGDPGLLPLKTICPGFQQTMRWVDIKIG